MPDKNDMPHDISAGHAPAPQNFLDAEINAFDTETEQIDSRDGMTETSGNAAAANIGGRQSETAGGKTVGAEEKSAANNDAVNSESGAKAGAASTSAEEGSGVQEKAKTVHSL